MRSMQWQLGFLGTISAFAFWHRETKKNLYRGGRSQDLPNTDFQPAVWHMYIQFRLASISTCAGTSLTLTTASHSGNACIYIPVNTESYVRTACNPDKHRRDKNATLHWISPPILLVRVKLNSFLATQALNDFISIHFTRHILPVSIQITT